MKKVIFSLVGIVAVLALIGAYYFPQFQTSVGASPTGTTWGTARIASINWSLASHLATSTSLYNYDTQPRIIESSFVTCESMGTSKTAYTGAGLANLIIRAATTTTEAPAVITNANYAANYATVATSTAVLLTASSTEGVINGYSRIWPAGTYLTFWSNATNTAQCTVGVKYIQR